MVKFICMTGSILVFTLMFWTVVGLFTLVDLTKYPNCILKYKIQPEKNKQVSVTEICHLLGTVIFNQLIVGIPCICMVYPLQCRMGMKVQADLPSFTQTLQHLAVFAVIEEIGFYYSHRLLHYSVFYKWIHKQHHEWTAPIALVTIYSHPAEFVISSFLPLVAGPVICGAHPFTTWLWYSLALSTTLIHHSGYHLPGLPSPEFHDYHHLKFNQNYGVLGVLDWLHGTDTVFRQSHQFHRHRVIFTPG